MISILVALATLAAIVTAVRGLGDRRGSGDRGHEVRLVFLYLSLLVSLLVSVSGLYGVLGRLFSRPNLVSDPSDFALSLSATLVGVPVLVLLARWTARRVAADREELQSAGWTVFITIGSLATLVATMFGAYGVGLWITGVERFDGFSLAQALVWGGAAVVLLVLDRRTARRPFDRFRHLVAALIGLGTSVSAVATLVAGLVEAFVDSRSEPSGSSLIDRSGPDLRVGLVLLVVGVPVWITSWLRALGRERESNVWRLHTVLVGVAGGIVTALVSASVIAYTAAVWWFGDPSSGEARRHFAETPSMVGAAFVGMLVWWYHRSLLRHDGSGPRAELDRVYAYVMSAGGLVAVAVGVTTLLAAAIDALTGTRIVLGQSSVNGLLLAGTLLLFGSPVWWTTWRREQSRSRAEGWVGPSRRVYLVSVVGVSGLAALGSAIATIAVPIDAALDEGLGTATLRSMRFPLAILLTAGVLAAYHVPLLRERAASVAAPRLGSVLLVGPADAGLVRAIADLGVRHVETWDTDEPGPWPRDRVLEALRDVSGGDAIVTLNAGDVVVRAARRSRHKLSISDSDTNGKEG